MLRRWGLACACLAIAMVSHGPARAMELPVVPPLAALEAAEYAAHFTGDHWSAPNRAQGLRFTWSAQRLEVLTRDEGLPVLALQTRSLGRATEKRALRFGAASAPSGDRVEQHCEQLTEWWLNSSEGLEHGWSVPSRPSGEGPLQLTVEVTGARVSVADNEARFISANSAPLSYRQLRAFDANHEDLPVTLQATAEGLRIEVDDAQAQYPITIDPLLQTASWSNERNQANAAVGFSVASAGDVNGDGYADVVVGAKNFDTTLPEQGSAFLFLGSASGLSNAPSWVAVADQANALFGSSVASAGDVNRDGFSDVIVGSPGYDTGSTVEAGRIDIFFGSATGLSLTPGWTVLAGQGQPRAHLGAAVSSAGDLNGDGFDDVIVGLPDFDFMGLVDSGRAMVFLGAASNMLTTPWWTMDSAAGAHFATSVAGVGDVNGDGFADVVVGAPDFANGQAAEGSAFLYLGTATGPMVVPSWSAEADLAGARFGSAVAAAGDVNADGLADVLVGARVGTNGNGSAALYLGTSTGLASTAVWQIASSQAGSAFGSALSSAGDINGDGYADVVVGSPGRDTSGRLDDGRADLFLGSSTGLSRNSAWSVTGGVQNAALGASVANAGDVNGDGFSDVLLGAPGYSGGQTAEGRVALYFGFAEGLDSTSTWQVNGGQMGARLGVSVAAAGDVNGDGLGDVIVGSEKFSNGQNGEGRAAVYLATAGGLSTTPQWLEEGGLPGASFGESVASAGDVNGDGFSDVIVGAPDDDTGGNQAGAARVYLGSAAGLTSPAAWVVIGADSSDRLGSSVASAGDVNADGFGDVIVGARGFGGGDDNDEGQAQVFLGGPAGLSNTPVWVVTSGQAGSKFGSSVASAGDVNGDGFSDVIVGAPDYARGSRNEGQAFVYLGNASGVSSTPAWTFDADQSDAHLGDTVASAGDVNADGYSDVVVGAPDYDSGQNEEGRGYLFLGSATGLANTPAWTAEGNQTGARFASSLAGAGDMNGDGFGDVVVGIAQRDSGGDNDNGAVWLFLGDSQGLRNTPAWTREISRPGIRLGCSVASAGDVNGDGFSDVIAGALNDDAPLIDEGSARVFFGGDDAPGVDRRMAQRFNGVARAPTPRVAAAGTLEMWVSDALAGRGPLSLETEVKPVTVAFNGAATQTSLRVSGGRVASVSVAALPNGRYHWRARVNSGPFHGRWVSFGGNFESTPDFVVAPGGLVPDGGVDGGVDAGLLPDGGLGPPLTLALGCGCEAPNRGGGLFIGAVLLIWLSRRRV